MKTIIYADVLFFSNLVINFILLYTTNGLLNRKSKLYKLIIGSVFLALYSVFLFYPQVRFLFSWIGKVSVSILILLIVFKPINLQDFGKTFVVFYLVNFLYGGIVFLLVVGGKMSSKMAISNGELYLNFSTTMLLISVSAAFVAVRTGLELIFKSIVCKKLYQDFIIHINNQKVLMHGFVDTGNKLTDPQNGNGVIVVSYDKIREYLPNDLKAILDGDIPNEPYPKVIKMVPYKSVGKEHGVLFGFEPDGVEILQQGNKRLNNVTICTSRQIVPMDRSFDAIINPKVLG